MSGFFFFFRFVNINITQQFQQANKDVMGKVDFT